MGYCQKCGAKLEENQNFCHGCGNKLNGKSKKMNPIWLVLIFGIIIIILLFVFRDNINLGVGRIINNPANQIQKESCPYDCCIGEDYKIKECSSQDYGCINNKCIAIDTDKDGLSDVEEKQIGTNPQLYDTDGDTLGDFKEYKEMTTDPLNKNSDSDRYDDNEDSEPLIKNSAKINIETFNKNWGWNYVNIVIAIVRGGVVKPDIVIADPSITLQISNIGDDYSEYVNFDLIFKVSNVEVSRDSISLAKINARDSRTKIHQKQIKAGDIPEMLINLVKEETSDWDIKVENVDYEEF